MVKLAKPEIRHHKKPFLKPLSDVSLKNRMRKAVGKYMGYMTKRRPQRSPEKSISGIPNSRPAKKPIIRRKREKPLIKGPAS